MICQILLLGFSLLTAIPGGTAKPQYALSTPVLLKSDENATVCVNFVRLNESLHVFATVEVFTENYTIFDEEIPAADLMKCNEFKVPKIKSAAPVFLTFLATGSTLRFYERRSLVIDPLGNVYKVQTDKPLYKPSDTVRVRLISLNQKLEPVEEKYSAVYAVDPSGNRMFQWLNLESDHGIVSLEFTLLSDASLGNYRIEALRESGDKISQEVPVEEYVPPKYSVSIDAPSTVTVLDKALSINTTAKYTYEQGVPGTITGKLCRRYSSYYPGNACNRNPEGLCQSITGKTDSDGTFGTIIDLTNYQLDRSGLDMSFTLQMTVSEEGTGVQITETKYISITNLISRVSFDRQAMSQYYKRGLAFLVRINVVNASGQPLGGENIELQLNGVPIQNLTTGTDGSAEYLIDTSDILQTEIQIQALYKNTEQCYDSNFLTPTYSNDFFSATRFYSRSGSFIQVHGPREELLCGQSYDLKVQYVLSAEGVEGDARPSVFYQVLSKAKIVQHGQHSLPSSSALKGELTFSIDVSSDLAPGADVIVYMILLGEVIADSVKLNVEKCFKHQVSMNFSAEKGIPGSTVDLKVSAAPSSLCGLRVIDSSLLLLNPYQAITAETVYNSLRYNSLNGYYVSGYNVAPPALPCIDSSNQIIIEGIYYEPVSSPNERDSFEVFRDIGLVFATNTTVHKPEVCGRYNSRPYSFPELTLATTSLAREVVEFSDVSIGGSSAESVITVRNTFPDIWNFDITPVGETGTTSITETVPGTITQWQFTGFCVSKDEGFGINKQPSTFNSILPFFVDLSLPYSFVRTETLVLKAVVVSYLEQCTKVGIELGASEAFTATLKDGGQDICICPNERASYSWDLNAHAIGVVSVNVTAWTSYFGATCNESASDTSQPFRKDTVMHTVIVEAEGIEDEITYSNFVSLEGNSVQIPISIKLPANVVEGSAKSSLAIVGDLFGVSVTNLQSLIRLPTGCGEQNLATLIPLPFIVRYLNCTGNLTPDIQAQAISYMETGYRRQLGYIRSDGSSSVFGGWNSPSSTWLDAQMFWTFENLKQFVFVDEAVQNRILLVLERTIDVQTGCFKPSGMLFNSALKASAEDYVSFTAYVVATLLQSNYPGGQTLLRGALKCLEDASRTEQSLYNRAVMYYAFKVAGNEERHQALLQQLQAEAIEEDGSIHWERLDKPKAKNTPFFYVQSPSAEVEITAYILLGMAYGSNHSQEQKVYMAQIVQWLAKQQNSLGGYSSTADTVVAVQALAAFGCLFPTHNTTQQVQLSSDNGVIATFNIDQTNRLLVQKQPLDNKTQNYSLDVQGTGSCLIQVTTKYNTPISEENSAFSLFVNTSSESCDNGVAYTYTIDLAVSYQGSKNQSNMAIVDVKMPSGYTTEYSSIVQLRNMVSKVEQKNNHVIVYLESVTNVPRHFSFKVEITNFVQNLQPQYVSAYDYYEKGENGIAVLNHPCAA
ncbi:ovostatin-like isoform X2 [Pelobates fuscus]|uniref:ovostatin-like isoform X2 n=1 Tax=Pelobates fuscus TaxID=191477 RepID=UPI002FE44724